MFFNINYSIPGKQITFITNFLYVHAHKQALYCGMLSPWSLECSDWCSENLVQQPHLSIVLKQCGIRGKYHMMNINTRHDILGGGRGFKAFH